MKKLILALVLLTSCALTPTKQTIYQNLITCTATTATPELRNAAIQCLGNSNPNNYAACLEPLAIAWTPAIIECVAANYEQASKSDGGTL